MAMLLILRQPPSWRRKFWPIGVRYPRWDESVETWIRRVNLLAALFPEFEVAPLMDSDRPLLIEQICLGARSFRAVRRQPVWPVLQGWLTSGTTRGSGPSLAQTVSAAFRSKKRLYATRRIPRRSCPARIQDLYDIEGGLTIADGRQRLKIEILAPNQRPIQVTEDLSSFWRETYPEIKPALAGRYPKHEWR